MDKGLPVNTSKTETLNSSNFFELSVLSRENHLLHVLEIWTMVMYLEKWCSDLFYSTWFSNYEVNIFKFSLFKMVNSSSVIYVKTDCLVMMDRLLSKFHSNIFLIKPFYFWNSSRFIRAFLVHSYGGGGLEILTGLV